MTHYDVLGVRPDAPPDEVHRAYLALARRHHPDRSGGDDHRMRTINEAWATLGDPTRRRQYDLVQLAPPRPAPPTSGAWTADPDSVWGRDRAGFDEDPDLDPDDRILRVTVAVPRWLSLLPPALFVASLVLGFGGMLFGPAVFALSLMAFVLSILLFLASPFVALYASRRPDRSNR
jgi:hypothetical protein